MKKHISLFSHRPKILTLTNSKFRIKNTSDHGKNKGRNNKWALTRLEMAQRNDFSSQKNYCQLSVSTTIDRKNSKQFKFGFDFAIQEIMTHLSTIFFCEEAIDKYALICRRTNGKMAVLPENIKMKQIKLAHEHKMSCFDL